MGRKRSEDLLLRLRRDTYVELGISSWKVLVHALVFAIATAVFVAVAIAWGPLLGVLPVVGIVLVLGLGVPPLLEMVRGTGPALRIDDEGLQLRRWREPLRITWADLMAVIPFRESRVSGPVLGFVVPPSVWADYRESRPARLRRFDRAARWNGLHILVPHKVLTAPARDLLEALSPETIASLTRVPQQGARLILVPEDHVASGLVFRSGRETHLDALKLRPGTVDALKAWQISAATTLTEWEQVAEQEGESGAYMFLERHASESRKLAARLTSEIGHGARVDVWLESPDYAAFAAG